MCDTTESRVYPNTHQMVSGIRSQHPVTLNILHQSILSLLLLSIQLCATACQKKMKLQGFFYYNFPI